jgi:hypothetical protein
VSEKAGSIAFVIDERVSRERGALLTRIINSLRSVAQVELLGSGITEEELLKKLEVQSYQLVLVPWYRYMAWSRVEAFYGLTRTSGPTFAGYFCEPLLPYELGEQADHLRAILLDYSNLNTREAVLVTKSLLKDTRRTGIRPLLEPSTSIYCENWYGNQGLGLRIESILSLPEIANTIEWSRRANCIRLCFMALWSLVYDSGPGKSELNQATAGSPPKAYFQIGVDSHALVIRLCYSMPGWTPKDALSEFWPNAKDATRGSQLLLKYADLVRVHSITGTLDVEVTATLFSSAPSERENQQVHTLWVEPIAVSLVSEVPFEAPNPNSPQLKPLPGVSLNELKPRVSPEESDQAIRAKERFIFEAATKIKALKDQISEKDEMIRELKIGGIGTSAPLPPADAENLLEAFQERYFEARLQIRQFEIQLNETSSFAQKHELEALRTRMNNLIVREQGWIKKLAATIEMIRNERRKSTGTDPG